MKNKTLIEIRDDLISFLHNKSMFFKKPRKDYLESIGLKERSRGTCGAVCYETSLYEVINPQIWNCAKYHILSTEELLKEANARISMLEETVKELIKKK